ncbi:MAG: polymer-forming cytoskeletal protein [Chthoniobacterales bacterium]|nr:polymer-forming cytoskeletal protein [Chthoniobacterales bacterium]
MPPRTAKQAVTCPKCGSSQQESAGVISTFCRACGHHFEKGGTERAKVGVAARFAPLKKRLHAVLEPWLLRYEPEIEKLRLFIERYRPPEFRRVRCHECGRVHEVPRAATSTGCPNCNAHIALEDVLVDKRLSRNVRTRGALIIKKFGYLNNQVTICGRADLGGGIAGKLFCDGETKIRTSGRLNCEIGSRRIRVERGADVIVSHPIRVHDMVVQGKLTARVFCNGRLRILKRGSLKGEVHARSITVDKGGLLQADLNIGQFDEENPDLLGTLQERTCYMALEDTAPPPSQATLPL